MADPHDEHAEEYEHIPWSQLVEEAPSRFAGTVGFLVAAGVGVILGAVGIGFLRGGASPPAGTAAVPAPLPATTATASPVVEPPGEVSVPPAPSLYREADLQAVLPAEETRLAAALAEHFVRDFFTADGQPGAGAVARAALPTPLGDELPHQVGWGLTYVEWSRAFRVDATSPDGYVVAVAVRLLAVDENNAFLRLPLRAVEVTLVRDASGLLAVADYPTPVAPPAFGDPDPIVAGTEPDGAVGAAALEALAAVDATGDVVTATPEGNGWRVVTRMSLGPTSFPTVVRVADP